MRKSRGVSKGAYILYTLTVSTLAFLFCMLTGYCDFSYCFSIFFLLFYTSLSLSIHALLVRIPILGCIAFVSFIATSSFLFPTLSFAHLADSH